MDCQSGVGGPSMQNICGKNFTEGSNTAKFAKVSPAKVPVIHYIYSYMCTRSYHIRGSLRSLILQSLHATLTLRSREPTETWNGFFM